MSQNHSPLYRCRRLAANVKWSLMGATNHISTSEPLIALTFDDGPDPRTTPALLAVLEKYRARATFFMVGESARKYPHLVEAVAAAGHAIGNHSWDHPPFPLISHGERQRQLRACQEALGPHGQMLFRPPFGHQTMMSSFDAWLLGYQVITWDVAARDWLDYDADWMANRIKAQLHPGSIVLFHDTLYTFLDPSYVNRSLSRRTLELLLEQMGQDFRFVALPQLLHRGRPRRQEWSIGSSVRELLPLERLREGGGRQWRYASLVSRTRKNLELRHA